MILQGFDAGENHKRFLSHLEGSRRAVEKAANWLRSFGHEVTIPPRPEKEAATYEVRMRHLDHGDLLVKDRVEVKQRSFHFTGVNDFPFSSMIVCSTHSWDKANPKPYAFIHFNKDLSHLAVIHGYTSPHWQVELIKDSRYEGYAQYDYVINVSLVKFAKVL